MPTPPPPRPQPGEPTGNDPTLPRGRRVSSRSDAVDATRHTERTEPRTVPRRSARQANQTDPATTPDGATHRATVPAAPRVVPQAPTAATAPATSAPPTRASRDTIDKFAVGEVLGSGGMGVVVRAVDRRLERALAIKRIHDATNQNAVAQFIEEAQITGQLEHPNIVPVHELGEDAGGRPWLAMKLVQGQTIRQLVKQWRADIEAGTSPRLRASDVQRMLDIIRRIADGIAFAHSRGVIHRDLKPANVMLGEFGEVLVMDWGLARPLGADADPTAAASAIVARPTASGRTGAVSTARRRDTGSALTMDGDVFGTPGFMPPEQARGDHDQMGPASDQFSLAGILYQMLTLHEPYREESAERTLFAARNHKLPPPHQRAPERGIPRELSAIVMKAMAARSQDRYPDVAAFIADCDAWQASERTTAFRPSPWVRLAKWFRRHPTAGVTGATATVLLAVFGIVGLSLESSRQLALAQQEAADARAREDRIALAIRNREFDELYRLTGARLQGNRDEIVADFFGEWRAWQDRQTAAGNFPLFSYYRASLSVDRLRGYLTAFDRLFQAHREFGVEVTTEDWFYSGLLKTAEQIGDFEGAIADFDRVLELDPTHNDAWVNRGVAKVRSGDIDGGIADYAEAIRLQPDHPPVAALMNRAGLLRERGDFEGSLADCRLGIATSPEDPRPYRYAGVALAEQGKHAEALPFFDQAIERKADYVKAYVSRGLSRAALGRFEEARSDYTQAIEHDGRHADAYLKRSWIHEQLGLPEAAAADMQRVTDLLPRDATWRIELARLQLDADDPAAALRAADKALNLEPENERAWRYRARALRAQRQYADAIEAYTRAIRFHAANPFAYHERGECHLQLLRTNDGMKDFEAVLRFEPGWWDVEAALAVLYVAAGRVDEANTAYLRAWRNCDDPDEKKQLGDMYRQVTGREPQ